MNVKERLEASKIWVGVGLLLICAGASTLASNITINTNNRIEFGQALYTVQACQSWVQINFSVGAVDSTGYSPINGLNIFGLDPTACAGTTISINVVGGPDGVGNSSLPLYKNLSGNLVNQLNFLIDSNGNIVLENSAGEPEYENDQITPRLHDEQLTYSVDPNTRDISFTFAVPVPSYMNQVNAVTLQTGSTPQPTH